MNDYYKDDSVRVIAGDCLDILRGLPDNSVDSVCTDPPYGLEFMGKDWDAPWKAAADVHANARTKRAAEVTPTGQAHSTSAGPYLAAGVNKFQAGRPFQQWCELWATECLRVLKPGGHMLAFGGTRTSHRLTCAIEDAGFEIRDSIAWLYGSGFPKSLDVSKAIDRAAGAQRRVVGLNAHAAKRTGADKVGTFDNRGPGLGGIESAQITATPDAERWHGWGTALKPAHEPIVVARKPLTGTVVANVTAWGTGGLNIDACRIATDWSDRPDSWKRSGHRSESSVDDGVVYHKGVGGAGITTHAAGRWPANVVLDETQAHALDQQSGETTSVASVRKRAGTSAGNGETLNRYAINEDNEGGFSDFGGASRFFYTAKADAAERVRVDGVAHPTVKPLSLMRWLVRLVTPPGGTVLEPFAGSGTTVEACILEGFRVIAIEREPDYLPLIVQRINRRRNPVAAVRADGGDAGLFDLLDGGAA